VRKIVLLAVVVGVAAAASLIAYALVSSWLVRNVGVVKAVGVAVYWDEACTRPCSEINWGNLTLGETKNVTVYVRNEGNVPITLNMHTENWNPPTAAEHLTLTWNYSGEVLQPRDLVPVAFSLSVDSQAFGFSSFSFEIWVVAQNL
jgi:hypothetical protein